MLRKIILYTVIFCVLLFTTGAEKAISAETKTETSSAGIENTKTGSSIKINSVIFDDSESGVFVFTNSTENENKPITITSEKLEGNRIFFDIKNAVITTPAKVWEFQYGDIEKVKLSQFSTKPNVVRIVFYYKDNFDPDYIKVQKLGKVITFKYNHDNLAGDYFMNLYRESEPSTQDYIEPLSVFAVEEIKPEEATPPASTTNKDISSIENALGVQEDQPQKVYTKLYGELKSKCYINNVDTKQGHLLVYGLGAMSLKKPIVLTEPTRLVYDFPNAVLNPSLKGKSFNLSNEEVVRVAQFDKSTVRVVITTSAPEKYRPIFSQNMQSILFSHDDKIANQTLFNSTAKLESIKMSTLNDSTDVLYLAFSAPILHSVKNTGSGIEIILYNTEGITTQQLNNAFYTSRINFIKANKFSQNGYRIVIPSSSKTKLDVNESVDGRKLKITIKTPPEAINAIPAPATPEKQKKQDAKKPAKTHTVVIDPGHGGSDVGATRANINEKDINLNISKKLANILINKGINVEMTHWQDQTQSLQERVDFAEAKKADLFVSVHANASNKEEIHGIETHYYHEYSKEFASLVQAQLAQKTSAHNRGILQSKFYVINHTTMPAILVETGFISNVNERNSLLSEKRQKQTAEAIAAGILEFLKKEK